MNEHRIFQMSFSKVYPLYIQKAERKNRTKDEVDMIICWLTGYTMDELNLQIEKEVDFTVFFDQAPKLNDKRHLITGTICGVKIAEIDHPLMKNIRYLDKLIDELAKGKALSTILRG